MTPPSIAINSVTAAPKLFWQAQCAGSASLTASGFKGKASVWMVRAALADVALGPAVKGVATTYPLGDFTDGSTIDPMAFELRDNKNRMLARSEMTVVMDCAPGLEVISVDVVRHPTRTGDCSLPFTWRPNVLPDSGVGEVYRMISDNEFVFDGLATVTGDLGVTRTESVTEFPPALTRPDDGESYDMWLEYIDSDRRRLGRSNVVTVVSSCPPPAE